MRALCGHEMRLFCFYNAEMPLKAKEHTYPTFMCWEFFIQQFRVDATQLYVQHNILCLATIQTPNSVLNFVLRHVCVCLTFWLKWQHDMCWNLFQYFKIVFQISYLCQLAKFTIWYGIICGVSNILCWHLSHVCWHSTLLCEGTGILWK